MTVRAGAVSQDALEDGVALPTGRIRPEITAGATPVLGLIGLVRAAIAARVKSEWRIG